VRRPAHQAAQSEIEQQRFAAAQTDTRNIIISINPVSVVLLLHGNFAAQLIEIAPDGRSMDTERIGNLPHAAALGGTAQKRFNPLQAGCLAHAPAHLALPPFVAAIQGNFRLPPSRCSYCSRFQLLRQWPGNGMPLARGGADSSRKMGKGDQESEAKSWA
jgi:hypothetical protein